MAYATNGSREALLDWLELRGNVPGALFCAVNKGGKIAVRPTTEWSIFYVLRRRGSRGKELSPDDMRRTSVGELLDAGADISTVQQWLVHANVTTTQRYDRREKLRSARRLNCWDARCTAAGLDSFRGRYGHVRGLILSHKSPICHPREPAYLKFEAEQLYNCFAFCALPGFGHKASRNTERNWIMTISSTIRKHGMGRFELPLSMGGRERLEARPRWRLSPRDRGVLEPLQSADSVDLQVKEAETPVGDLR